MAISFLPMTGHSFSLLTSFSLLWITRSIPFLFRTVERSSVTSPFSPSLLEHLSLLIISSDVLSSLPLPSLPPTSYLPPPASLSLPPSPSSPSFFISLLLQLSSIRMHNYSTCIYFFFFFFSLFFSSYFR